jgi:hypothetical protein
MFDRRWQLLFATALTCTTLTVAVTRADELDLAAYRGKVCTLSSGRLGAIAADNPSRGLRRSSANMAVRTSSCSASMLTLRGTTLANPVVTPASSCDFWAR